MKYNVGDKVRVRSDLIEDKSYYMENGEKQDDVVSSMMSLKGQVVTIKEFWNGKYLIEESSWNWTDEMFEGLAEETPKKFHIYDTVKHEIFGLGTVIGTDGGIAKYKVDFDNLDYSLLVDGHTCYCLPNELTLVEAYTGGEAD